MLAPPPAPICPVEDTERPPESPAPPFRTVTSHVDLIGGRVRTIPADDAVVDAPVDVKLELPPMSLEELDRRRADAGARLEQRLVVWRGRRPLLTARLPNATLGLSHRWHIERNGMLYLSLADEQGPSTVVALRSNEAPRLSTAWCRSSTNTEVVHGAFATQTGPILLRGQDALIAIRPEDGTEAWRVPWTSSTGPFTLIDLHSTWIVCDRDIGAIDPIAGKLRWRSTGYASAADCIARGAHVAYASRRCIPSGCTSDDSGVLDAATGQPRWHWPNEIEHLLLVDRDWLVVAQPTGVTILDARTGTKRGSLALKERPWAAESLADGDALLYGGETLRVTLPDLKVRWRLDGVATRHEDLIVTGDGDPKNASSWLDVLDLATGKKRRISLTAHVAGGPYEFARTRILGWGKSSVDVETTFGHYVF
jgi:hypothetical protein